jgi:hypothetical protein
MKYDVVAELRRQSWWRQSGRKCLSAVSPEHGSAFRAIVEAPTREVGLICNAPHLCGSIPSREMLTCPASA